MKLVSNFLLQITDEFSSFPGMTYDELNTFGRLRKQQNCGPYSMFTKLVPLWAPVHTPQEVAEKVKHFFRCYAINRHKMTVLTPSYHAEFYSPDDNRFDHRPFLYNVSWAWQFRIMDEKLHELSALSPSSSLDSKRSEGYTIGESKSSDVSKKSKSRFLFMDHGSRAGGGVVVSNNCAKSFGSSSRLIENNVKSAEMLYVV